MKLRDLLQMAQDEPHLLDYTLVLSEYIAVPGPDTVEPFRAVTDFPIRAIVSHDEGKEMRFVMYQSDIEMIEQSRDKVLKIVQDIKGAIDDAEGN